MANNLKIRVITCKEGDQWIAQCLEYDIGAQGDSPEDVTARFELCLALSLQESLDRTGKPFGGIEPAPQHFHKLWKRRSNLSSQTSVPFRTNNGAVDVNMALYG